MNHRRPVGVICFAGAGGMSLGFEQAGFEVVAALDNEPINVKIHSKNHPCCRTLLEDVTKVTGKKRLDTSAASVTNRSTSSSAGRPARGSPRSEGATLKTRGTACCLEFARLVGELRPNYFVIENVKGLLFSRTSKTLGNCLDWIDRIRY